MSQKKKKRGGGEEEEEEEEKDRDGGERDPWHWYTAWDKAKGMSVRALLPKYLYDRPGQL